jgi:hypothetical protein
MSWDATKLLEGDPDQPGELCIRVLVDPKLPLPLAMVECAADLDIAITVKRSESDFPHLLIYEVCLSGTCMALSEFDMRLAQWQRRHRIANKSEVDIHLERIAQLSAKPE